MKLTHKQLTAISPHVRTMLAARLALWDASNAIEAELGCDINSHDTNIDTICSCLDSAENINEATVREYLEGAGFTLPAKLSGYNHDAPPLP